MAVSYFRKYRDRAPGLTNPHLWIIIVLFVLLTISHFAQSLPQIPVLHSTSIPAALELSRHSLERLCYLLLILYSGWTLGLIASAGVWLSSATAMLVRTSLFSVSFRDALLESLAVLIIGALAIVLMAAYRQNRRQREKLKKTVKAMKLARQNYEELFTDASDAIWVHDLKGNITMVNKACEKLSGYPISELPGRNVLEFLSPENLSIAKQVKDKLLRGETMEQRYEQRLIKKDGSQATMQLTTRLIFGDGKPQAFHNMARDVTEERRLQDNLQYYCRQVLQAQEEERKRLARELHDDASQQIILLTRGIDNIAYKADRCSPEELRNELGKLYELSQQTYQNIKHYAQALRPSILDDLGLIAAVKWLAQETRKLSGIEIEVKTHMIPLLPPETQLVLFRIIQESLNNIQRHSRASQASVTLEWQGAEIRVTIADNGKGFSLPRQLTEFAGQGKLGLTGMVERAQLIGGELEVTSEKDKGTIVTVKVPIKLYAGTIGQIDHND
jgi:two-component system sensor histidine kinase DegS